MPKIHMKPNVRILPRNSQQSLSEYETWIEMFIDELKKTPDIGPLKVTWLVPNRDDIVCIVEWCIQEFGERDGIAT